MLLKLLLYFREANYLNISLPCTDTCCERGELYTVYVISVTKHNNDGSQEVWEVFREYSDFEHLHSKITERVRKAHHNLMHARYDEDIVSFPSNNWPLGEVVGHANT